MFLGIACVSSQSALWDSLVETFGKDMTVLRKTDKKVAVKIICIPSAMREWVMAHVSQCEVISPKKFREEIQKNIMEAYKKYWR